MRVRFDPYAFTGSGLLIANGKLQDVRFTCANGGLIYYPEEYGAQLCTQRIIGEARRRLSSGCFSVCAGAPVPAEVALRRCLQRVSFLPDRRNGGGKRLWLIGPARGRPSQPYCGPSIHA